MDKEIILYTTHCPQCKVLEAKLKEKKINYSQITNVELMLQKGMDSVPVLEVEGKLLNYSQALKWVMKEN